MLVLHEVQNSQLTNQNSRKMWSFQEKIKNSTWLAVVFKANPAAGGWWGVDLLILDLARTRTPLRRRRSKQLILLEQRIGIIHTLPLHTLIHLRLLFHKVTKTLEIQNYSKFFEPKPKFWKPNRKLSNLVPQMDGGIRDKWFKGDRSDEREGVSLSNTRRR